MSTNQENFVRTVCPITGVTAPNLVSCKNKDFHISYNPSVQHYGVDTTALVFKGRVFLVLNGDHRETFPNDSPENAMRYFLQNINLSSHYSEHMMLFNPEKDIFDLAGTVKEIFGEELFSEFQNLFQNDLRSNIDTTINETENSMTNQELINAVEGVFGVELKTSTYGADSKLSFGPVNHLSNDFIPKQGTVIDTFHDNHHRKLREHFLVENSGVVIHYRLCAAFPDSGYEAYATIHGAEERDSESYQDVVNTFYRWKDSFTAEIKPLHD